MEAAGGAVMGLKGVGKGTGGAGGALEEQYMALEELQRTMGMPRWL